MAAKMGFLVALIVALSVGGSEAARTLADMQNKDSKGDSPALTHWQSYWKKATATVTPNLFRYDSYYKNVADAKLFDSKALCKKGNLDCKPAATATPNVFRYSDYYKNVADATPALTHWQHALPTVSIPQTLKELISPLSSQETAETLQIIDKEKATATVTPNFFTYDAYYKNVADAKLFDSKALCEKGNLDCKPAATVTPNLFPYNYHKNVADAK